MNLTMKNFVITFSIILSVLSIGYVSYQDSEQQKRQEMDKIYQEAQVLNNNQQSNSLSFILDMYQGNKKI